MKALTFKRYGQSPDIGVTDVPCPSIKASEMLVEVHAVGLNPIDYKITTGKLRPVLKPQLPATMGCDLAGVVKAVGPEVKRFKVGDAVFACLYDLGAGALAEFAVVPEHAAALKPSNLDFIQAAAMPMVSLTALQALRERANLRAGQKVFIPAGSGGIGSCAIQVAKHLGAFVGTTTSTGNVALVKRLGADEVIDYKQQSFERVLSGYDVALATLEGKELERALEILKPGGTMVSLVGPLDAPFARDRRMGFVFELIFGLMSLRVKRLARRRGVGYAFMFVRPDGRQLAEISQWIEAGYIRPVIDRVFPFDRAPEALDYLAQGRAKGKVVVQIQ